MVLLWFVMNFIFSKWFIPFFESVGKFFASKITERIILILEVLVLVIPFAYIIGNFYLYFTTNLGKGYFSLYWVILTLLFLVWVFATTALIVEYKTIHSGYKFPFINWFGKRVERIFYRLKRIYIFNRIGLLFSQFPDLLKSIMILYISLVFLTILPWSDEYYFLGFLFVPLYANYWVYYNRVFTVNENLEEVFIRRVCLYVSMMVVATYELFTKYESFLYEIKSNFNFWILLMTGSGVLYIALDRILKEITADYIKFKKEHRKTSNTKGEQTTVRKIRYVQRNSRKYLSTPRMLSKRRKQRRKNSESKKH